MADHIKMFKASDDSQVSESPTTINVPSFTLRADQNEVGTAEELYVKAKRVLGKPVRETPEEATLTPEEAR